MATVTRPARTTRIPNAFAGVGAVAQSGGNLPIYRCNTCGAEVVWAKSTRTGRAYLANVWHGYLDQRYYIAASVHDCSVRLTAIDAEAQRVQKEAAGHAFAEAMEAQRRKMAAGEITQDEFLTWLDGVSLP